MDTFKPSAFTMHITRAQFGSVQRCNLCKEPIEEGSTIIVNNGNYEHRWMFSVVHLDCLRKLLENAFYPLNNESVYVTPKVTKEGGKVEVNVGKHTFVFPPEHAYNLAVTLHLAAIAAEFDTWAYHALSKASLDARPVLVAMRTKRGQKTITDVTTLGNPQGLLLDCWNMFSELCKELFPFCEPEMNGWYTDFKTRFGIKDGGKFLQ